MHNEVIHFLTLAWKFSTINCFIVISLDFHAYCSFHKIFLYVLEFFTNLIRIRYVNVSSTYQDSGLVFDIKYSSVRLSYNISRIIISFYCLVKMLPLCFLYFLIIPSFINWVCALLFYYVFLVMRMQKIGLQRHPKLVYG